MAAITRAGPDQSQETGVPSRSHMQLAGPQVLGPSAIAFLGAPAGSWIRSAAARTQTRILSDAGNSGSGFNGCATTLTPKGHGKRSFNPLMKFMQCIMSAGHSNEQSAEYGK